MQPEGKKVTNKWLEEGTYELESMGNRFPATLHLKSPFDPKNARVQGDYSGAPAEPEGVKQFLTKYEEAMNNKSNKSNTDLFR